VLATARQVANAVALLLAAVQTKESAPVIMHVCVTVCMCVREMYVTMCVCIVIVVVC